MPVLTRITAKLSDKLVSILRRGVQSAGTFEPALVIAPFEEEMTGDEFTLAETFLNWVCENKKTFGHNIQEVYAEYLEATGQDINPLVGRTIVGVREMTPHECKNFGFHMDEFNKPKVVELDGGMFIVPLMDLEGNGPGTLLVIDDDTKTEFNI